jgi:hypothetical protein
MSSLASTIRGFLERSFLSLPILIFGWALFVGSTTGNIGLLVLSLGHATVAPLATWILHTLASFLPASMQPYMQVPASSTCNILSGGFVDEGSTVYSIPSYWLAHIAFFFGFLLSNAAEILNMPAAENAPADKVERRKSQAQLVLGLSVALFILFVGVRVFKVGCETIPGVVLGIPIFYSIGYGWYKLARECSARDSDVFGIVQGILPPSASDPPPMTCVYTGK